MAEAEPSLGLPIDNPYFKRIFPAAAGGAASALATSTFFRGSTGLAALFAASRSMDGTLSRDRPLANLATVRTPRKTSFCTGAERVYFVLFRRWVSTVKESRSWNGVRGFSVTRPGKRRLWGHLFIRSSTMNGKRSDLHFARFAGFATFGSENPAADG